MVSECLQCDRTIVDLGSRGGAEPFLHCGLYILKDLTASGRASFHFLSHQRTRHRSGAALTILTLGHLNLSLQRPDVRTCEGNICQNASIRKTRIRVVRFSPLSALAVDNILTMFCVIAPLSEKGSFRTAIFRLFFDALMALD